jgi:Tfp pilus assembly protein PilZ
MYLGPGNEPVSRKPTDRRRDRRLPMNAAVSKLDPRATTPVSDLSASGVFVHTADPLPIGSEIELKFTVHLEEPVLFEARGRVVRHGATGEPIGMGVEFIELDDSMRDVLKKLELKFTVHLEEPVLFEARGRVVRHGATGEPIGMGVEFIELDDSMRDVLKKLELKAEADRARPTLAHTDPGLRTHGLVARLVGSRE